MAAQYITLEEAAARLGIPTDEFKKRLKTEWTHLVPMRDGPTLRFRDNQIDELARQLGAASDPDLPLAPMGDSAEHGSDDFKVKDAPPRSPKPGKTPAPPADEPLMFDTSDDDLFSLSADATKGSSSKSGDSSDSDVRLEAAKSKPRKGKGGEPEAIPTEEIALDMGGGPSSAVIKGGSSAKLSAPKSSAKLTAPDAGKSSGKGLSGKSKAPNNPGDSSEFELSLDADSDDFELQLNADSSDEVDLGSSPVEEAGPRAGKSGINLRDPADSGVNLERGRKNDSSGRNLSGKKSDSGRGRGAPPKSSSDSDEDVDFELSLEPEPAPGASSGRRGGSKASGKKPVTTDSDSEFELTLDDSGEGASLEAAAEADESKGDIFETDFEIPPMSDESGSEAVPLDSDTDLEAEPDVALDPDDVVAEEETGSQVVLLEDEQEAAPAPSGRRSSKRRPAADEEAGDVDLADVDEEESASGALRNVKARRDDVDEAAEPAGATRAAPAPWGPLPALILMPALLFVILGGLMSFELLHTMIGYQQPRKPAAPLVRGMAKTLDMELRDQ